MLKDYASCLKGQKEYLVFLYLDAMGLEIGTPNEKKLTWEGFVELNCFLKYSNQTKESYYDFFSRILDPTDKGYVVNQEYNKKIEELFSS